MNLLDLLFLYNWGLDAFNNGLLGFHLYLKLFLPQFENLLKTGLNLSNSSVYYFVRNCSLRGLWSQLKYKCL